jgi:Tfp pilus assembly protein PilF
LEVRGPIHRKYILPDATFPRCSAKAWNKGLNDKAAAAYEKALELQPNYPEASKALAAMK